MTNMKTIVKPLSCLSVIFIFSAQMSAAAAKPNRNDTSWVKKISNFIQHKSSNNKDSAKEPVQKSSDVTPPDPQVTPVIPTTIATETPPSITPPIVTTQKTASKKQPAIPPFIPTAYAAPSIEGLYSNENFSSSTTKLLNEIGIALAVVGLLLVAGSDKLLRSKVGADNLSSDNQLSST